MSECISSFPMLNSQLLINIGYSTELTEFSYSENFERFNLAMDRTDGNLFHVSGKLTDPRCTWYPDTHNLVIHKKCSIVAGYHLFGKGGIVPLGATVGIALSWISSESEERGVIPFGCMTIKDVPASFQLDYSFERGRLKGSLRLQTILYLKNAGNCKSDELYFARHTGSLLGVLDQTEVFIDGNGSVFPVVTVDEPGEALWKVYFDDTCDPLQDKFDSNNVEIRLNRAHPAYAELSIESSLKNTPLLLEILTSALIIIIESVKETAGDSWEQICNGTECEPGSIASAIHYFIAVLQWDISSPSKLAISIKDYLEQNKYGGA